MLEFSSASMRSVNSERAVDECLDIAFPDGDYSNIKVIIFNATLGHKMDKIGQAISAKVPNAKVFGASGCAVTGREGVGESMNELAIMSISGPDSEFATASVEGIYGDNAYEKAAQLANSLKSQREGITSIYLLCPGIDINNIEVLRAFVDTFGEEVTIFGGTSSDNMRGKINYQYHNDILSEHDAWAVGFADPTIKAITRATHGFQAYGEPLTVTRAEGHRIYEFDGQSAWTAYTNRLSLTPQANTGDTIPIGALAEELSPALAQEYGNGHILRAVTKQEDGVMYYPTTVKNGLKLYLTERNEDLIFSEQQRALDYLCEEIGNGKPIAVFQTDCLARGRFLFNRIVKDEIIAMMHSALSTDDEVPPWLGNYGFGEYARLGGKNTYHNYSTALLVLYR